MPFGRAPQPLTDAQQIDRTVTFAWLATVGLVVLIGSQVIEARSSKAIQGWPAAEGTILTSNVFVSNGGRRPCARADVTYSYKVGVNIYQGSRIALERYGCGRRLANTVVARYSPGSTTPVYYRPGDPTDSLLDRSPLTLATWLFLVELLGAGLLFRYALTETRAAAREQRENAAAIARNETSG